MPSHLKNCKHQSYNRHLWNNYSCSTHKKNPNSLFNLTLTKKAHFSNLVHFQCKVKGRLGIIYSLYPTSKLSTKSEIALIASSYLWFYIWLVLAKKKVWVLYNLEIRTIWKLLVRSLFAQYYILLLSSFSFATSSW